MNFRSIDLNLLVLLQALLEERHVSRAAHRAGLTQPAMSNALERCRRLFRDPLLERHGRDMRLTALAEALREPLAALLGEVGRLIEAAPMPLAELKRRIGIVLADGLAAVLARPLLTTLQAEGPGLSVAFLAWTGGAAAIDRLRGGGAELAVSVLPPTPAGEFGRETLLEERYLLAGRIGHPALANPSVEAWLDCRHVVVSPEGVVRTPLDDALAAQGLVRRVAVAVPSFLLVADLLRHSDLLALLPSLALSGDHGAGLMTCPPPWPLPGFRLDMAWHARNSSDPAIRFVASAIRDLLRGAAERVA